MYSVKRRELSTQAGGLRYSTEMEVVRLPIQRLWVLFLRKFNIQLQSVVLKPSGLSFQIRFKGKILLTVELTSTNNNLTLVIFKVCED